MSELEPTAGEGQRWQWEWAGTPAAERVAVWMRTGHGHDGALHALVLYLVTSRLSYAEHLD